MPTRVFLTTAPRPGAIAILTVAGPDVVGILKAVTGRSDWIPGRVRLVDLAGVDEGVAVLLRSGESGCAQLMPHGGPRVVQCLLEKLASLGVATDTPDDPRQIYPEASSPIEADMLATIAQAASPAAIDRLAGQPDLWRQAVRDKTVFDPSRVLADSAVLDRLIEPPMVVVVGRANVGKSTLTNHLMGRTVSLVADLPGTTRDWVGGLVEIEGVALHWHDTPGLRSSDDPIEQRAIRIARRVMASADVLIAMRDPYQDWPATDVLPREPDLCVVNKVDQQGSKIVWHGAIPISAQTGEGIDRLKSAVISCLQLDRVSSKALWAFSPTLRRVMDEKLSLTELSGYLGLD